MLFFVGVGMMLDWHILVDEPLGVLTVLAIILFGKSISVFVLVHFMGYPLHTTLSVGAALAQIGEFTFILASQAITLKLMDPSVMSLLVAASILSIALNPIVFASTKPFRRFLTQHFAWARRAAMADDLSKDENLFIPTPTKKSTENASCNGSGGRQWRWIRCRCCRSRRLVSCWRGR